MTPRPLYRWKSFWLGLIAIAFLCWAWSISMERYTTIHLRSPVGWIAIGQFQGEAGIFASKVKSLWATDIFDAKLDGSILGQPEMWKLSKTSWGILITSHFWPITIITLTWATFLTWRMRRIQRLP